MKKNSPVGYLSTYAPSELRGGPGDLSNNFWEHPIERFIYLSGIIPPRYTK